MATIVDATIVEGRRPKCHQRSLGQQSSTIVDDRQWLLAQQLRMTTGGRWQWLARRSLAIVGPMTVGPMMANDCWHDSFQRSLMTTSGCSPKGCQRLLSRESPAIVAPIVVGHPSADDPRRRFRVIEPTAPNDSLMTPCLVVSNIVTNGRQQPLPQ